MINRIPLRRFSTDMCKICYFPHKVIGSDPCQFLLNPDGLSSTNFFDFYMLPKQFEIDLNLLQNTYKQYQAVLHPDKFSLASDDLQNSSTILSSYASNGV